MKMRCIECGTSNSFRDRTKNQGFCKQCGHQFAFEPELNSSLQMTDSFFLQNLNIFQSINSSLFFTSKQLLFYINRCLARIGSIPLSNLSFIFTWSILIGFPIALSVGGIYNNTLLFYEILLGNGSIITALAFLRETEYSSGNIQPQQFQELLDRWQQVNGKIANLLPPSNETDNAIAIDTEISNYSFDAVIVCDRSEIAQFLIANNFHFENNCAILSIDGYPRNIFATVMQMLRRNSELKVYALHDANPYGVSLVHTLRTDSNWFPDSNVQIFDLGLLPRQIMRNRRISIRVSQDFISLARQLATAVRQNLTEKELEWLDKGYFVELESLTPRRLLRAVNQGIAKSQEPNSNDSLFSVNEDEDYVYYSNSFG